MESTEALIAKYRVTFTGKVITEFSKPSPFKIVPAYAGDKMMAKEAYGYSGQMKHPTPTDPHGKK